MIGLRKLRVKKPHDEILDKIGLRDSVFIDDRAQGLYMCRLAKQNQDLIGIRRIKQDKWLMYGKRKPKDKRFTSTHAQFIYE